MIPDDDGAASRNAERANPGNDGPGQVGQLALKHDHLTNSLRDLHAPPAGGRSLPRLWQRPDPIGGAEELNTETCEERTRLRHR